MGKYCRNALLVMLIGTGNLWAQAVQATTIVDTFENATAGLWPLVANTGTPFVSNTDSGLAGVIGGVRDGTVSYTSGFLNVSGSVVVAGGLYSLSLQATTDGLSTLSYDAGGAGLNLDLLDPHGTGLADLDASSFIVDVLASDLGGVPIAVTLTDGGGGSDTIGSIAAGGGQVKIPLSDFLVDFSDIYRIDVAFDPASNGDIAVSYIGLDWVEKEKLPEPATLALMGLGLAGIGYGRHRSKNAA